MFVGDQSGDNIREKVVVLYEEKADEYYGEQTHSQT